MNLHAKRETVSPEAGAVEAERRQRGGGAWAKRGIRCRWDLSRVDSPIQLVARPDHAAPVEEVVADEEGDVTGEVVAQADVRLGNEGELVPMESAAVAGHGETAPRRAEQNRRRRRRDERGFAFNANLFVSHAERYLCLSADIQRAKGVLQSAADLASVELIRCAKEVLDHLGGAGWLGFAQEEYRRWGQGGARPGNAQIFVQIKKAKAADQSRALSIDHIG